MATDELAARYLMGPSSPDAPGCSCSGVAATVVEIAWEAHLRGLEHCHRRRLSEALKSFASWPSVLGIGVRVPVCRETVEELGLDTLFCVKISGFHCK